MFVPWVALLAAELGPIAGALAGVAATGLYFADAELVGLPHDPVTLMLRLAPLVGVGLAAGYSSRRISSDALELQETSAVQRALLDSTLDGICLTDASGRLLLANAPLQEISLELGLPPYGTVTERLLALAERTTEPESLQRADARARRGSGGERGRVRAQRHRPRLPRLHDPRDQARRNPRRQDLDAAGGDGRPPARAVARRLRGRGLPRAANAAHLGLRLPRAARRRGGQPRADRAAPT